MSEAMAGFSDIFWKDGNCISIQNSESACPQLEGGEYVLVDYGQNAMNDNVEIAQEEVTDGNVIVTPMFVDADGILSFSSNNEASPAIEVGQVEIDIHTSSDTGFSVNNEEATVNDIRSDSSRTSTSKDAEYQNESKRTEQSSAMLNQKSISHRSRISVESKGIAKRKHVVIFRYHCNMCWKKFREKSQLNSHIETRHPKQACYRCKSCKAEFMHALPFFKHRNTVRSGTFSCVICDELLDTCKDIEDHQNHHTERVIQQCSNCNAKFTSKSKFCIHSKTHIRKYMFPPNRLYVGIPGHTQLPYTLSCSFCSKVFKYKNNLYKHFLMHSNSRYFTCTICNQRLESYSALRRHKSQKHTENFICEQCGKDCVTKLKFNRHKQIHSQEKPHLCNICGKTFKHKHTLHSHIKRHGDQLTVFCQFCKKKLKGRTHLLDHIRSKHKETLTFKCEYCSKTFPTEMWYKEHLYTHTQVKGFKCHLCQKEFVMQHYFKEHLLSHEKQKKEKEFPCNVCGKISKCLSKYKTHMLTHTKECTNPCPICGKYFKHSFHVKVHINNVHHKNKQYKCAFCSKAFTAMTRLRIHEARHSNTAKYVCKKCGKEYVEQQDFFDHMKSHLQCKYCPKSFVQKIDLLKHERIHKHEKMNKPIKDKKVPKTPKKSSVKSLNKPKFVCKVCGSELKTKSSLKSHLLIHDVMSNKCLYCDKTFALIPALLAHESSHVSSDLTNSKKRSTQVRSIQEEISPKKDHDQQRDVNQKIILESLKLIPKGVKHSRDPALLDNMSRGDKCTRNNNEEQNDENQEENFEQLKVIQKESGNSDDQTLLENMSTEDRDFIESLENPIELRKKGSELIGKRCEECGKFYANKKQLLRHKLTHTRTRKFSCPICKKVFIENFHVTQHLTRVHKGAKPFKCEVCQESFGKEWHLRRHIKTHHPEKHSYVCSVCGQEFYKKSELTDHRFTHEVSVFRCKYCEKKFSWKGVLVAHEKRHETVMRNEQRMDTVNEPNTGDASCSQDELSNSQSDEALQTSVDTEIPNSLSAGRQSEQIKKKNSSTKIKSPISPTTMDGGQPLGLCSKETDKDVLNRSIEMDTNGMFPCNLCGKSFGNKRNIKRHMKTRHFCSKTFSCPICGRAFKSRCVVSEHIYMVHKGAKPYKCDFCNESFAKHCSLRAHIKYNHPDKYMHVCSVCEEEFHSNKALSKHKLTHSETTFKCRFCDMAFSWRPALVQHEKTHTSDKKEDIPTLSEDIKNGTELKKTLVKPAVQHQCEECNETFPLKCDLILHSKTHIKASSYPCPLCGKRFETNMEVPQHISNDHLHSKPYKCPHCIGIFYETNSLVNHIKTSHSNINQINEKGLISIDKLQDRTKTVSQDSGVKVKVVMVRSGKNQAEISKTQPVARDILNITRDCGLRELKRGEHTNVDSNLLLSKEVHNKKDQQRADITGTLEVASNALVAKEHHQPDATETLVTSKALIDEEYQQPGVTGTLEVVSNALIEKESKQRDATGALEIASKVLIDKEHQQTNVTGTLEVSSEVLINENLQDADISETIEDASDDASGIREQTLGMSESIVSGQGSNFLNKGTLRNRDDKYRNAISSCQTLEKRPLDAVCKQGTVTQKVFKISYISDTCPYTTRSRSAKVKQIPQQTVVSVPKNLIFLSEHSNPSDYMKGKSRTFQKHRTACQTTDIKRSQNQPSSISKQNITSRKVIKEEADTSKEKSVSCFGCSLCKDSFDTSRKLIIHLRDDHGWSIPSDV